MGQKDTETKQQLSLIVLKEDCFWYDALSGYYWDIRSKSYFNDNKEIKEIIPLILQNNPRLPQEILYTSNSRLNSKQEKIGILAELINISKHASDDDKLQLNLIYKKRVKLLEIKKLDKYGYTASYEEYNDFPITDETKFDVPIKEAEKELKKYHPRRQFLVFEPDIQTFAEYIFKLPFFLRAQDLFNSKCYPEMDWLLTIQDPLERLLKVVQGLRQANLEETKHAFEWMACPDVVPLSDKNIPIIKVKESGYKSLLDFSECYSIYLSMEERDYINKYDHTQLGIVASDPDEYGHSIIKAGILVDLCQNRDKDSYLPYVQPQRTMLFNMYEKQGDILLARIFKYKDNSEYNVTSEDMKLLLDDCINLALDYLVQTNREKYSIFLCKLLYIEKFEYGDKYTLIFFLLLPCVNIGTINSIIIWSSIQIKIDDLKASLKKQLAEISYEKIIRRLQEVPDDYIPCIGMSDFDLRYRISLRDNPTILGMDKFKEMAEDIYLAANKKNADIILINSCDTKLGIQVTVNSIFNAKFRTERNIRVAITDLVLVNRTIYAATKPADDKLTEEQLIQVRSQYQELVPKYNEMVMYKHAAYYSSYIMGLYNHTEHFISESQFLHNNSYAMMVELDLELLPITLTEKFELIKVAVDKKLLEKKEEEDKEKGAKEKQDEEKGDNVTIKLREIVNLEEFAKCINEGNWKEGLAYINILISHYQRNSVFHFIKAGCLYGLNRYEDALYSYEFALDVYNDEEDNFDELRYVGDLCDIYFAQAKCLYALSRYTEVADSLNKAEESDTNKSSIKEIEAARKEIALKLPQENIIDKLKHSIETLPLPDNVRTNARELYASYDTAENETHKSDYLHYLKTLLSFPWGKKDKLEVTLKTVEEVLEKSHFGLNDIKQRIVESLIFSLRGGSTRPPILCFVGPAGVGKTSIANAIAVALGRKCASLPLGGMSDSAAIIGFSRTYLRAEHGKVLSLIKQADSWNPVIILDEIDKIDHGPRKIAVEGALLALLDPQQNSKFSDMYFDVTFDLSEVLFIVTANSIEDISYPLLDRMEIIKLSGYTDSEKLEIAKRYIIPKILEEANLSIDELNISDSVIKELIINYTKEAGVRELNRLLKSFIQKCLLNQERVGKKEGSKIINKELLEEYFSSKKLYRDTSKQEPFIGKVTGLAYTSSGGNIIKVEARTILGSGKIKATGSLGKVLQESIDVAYTSCLADLADLKIEMQDMSKKDIHIHAPEGAVPKEGPSAGVTIYTAIASLLSGRKVLQDIAMTGEIGLYGEVIAIGGLKEKLAAAVRESIKTVIIPEQNRKDLVDIPEELKNQLNIRTISKVSELLEIAFDKN